MLLFRQQFIRLAAGILLLLPVLYTQAQHLPAVFHPLRLHADKQFFLPGESVFFSVYKATSDSLPVRSCIVALVDENDRVVDTRRLLLTDEPASAYFVLPATDSAPYYSLQCRPDTSGAMPVTGTVLFSKLVKHSDTSHQNKPGITWVPESGQQTGNGSPVFYFRIRNRSFSSVPLRYALVDKKNDTLQEGITGASGSGRVELPVSAGPCYLRWRSGDRLFSEAVPALPDGFQPAVLNVYPVQGAWVGRLRAGQEGSYTLLLSQEGLTYYRGDVYLKAGDDFAKTFPAQQVRKGLSYMRLQDQQGRLLGERPIYHPAEVPLVVTAVKRLRPDKIRVQLNREITGMFSVSVVPLNEVYPQPAKADDSLLQVAGWQGWERKFHGADSLTLQVRDAGKGDLYANRDIKLFMRTPVQDEVLETKTDMEGKLKLDRTLIQDSASILVLPGKKQKADEKLQASEIGEVFIPDRLFVRDFGLPGINAEARKTDIAQPDLMAEFSRYKAKLLKEVVVKTRARSSLEITEEKYASSMYRSKVHQVAAFDFTSGYDNELMGSMLTFLQSRIPPVKSTSITSGAVSDGYNYYVNESLVDRTTANSIPLSDIAYISVMGRNFVPVTGEMGPAVLIYTKKGRDRYAGQEVTEKNQLLKVQGFAASGKYFNPLFDEGDFPASLRTTLYWNHRFRMKGDDQISIELFTAYRGPVLLRLFGWDESGNFRTLEQVIDQ